MNNASFLVGELRPVREGEHKGGNGGDWLYDKYEASVGGYSKLIKITDWKPRVIEGLEAFQKARTLELIES